jgi:hypothetical protein
MSTASSATEGDVVFAMGAFERLTRARSGLRSVDVDDVDDEEADADGVGDFFKAMAPAKTSV